jgi:ABC-type glycerol-3-phosphate transport system permease component
LNINSVLFWMSRVMVLLILLSWTLIPLTWFFMMSFTTYGGLPRGFELPRIITLDSYKAVIFGEYSVLPGIRDSILFASACIMLVFLGSLTTAYASSRMRGRFTKITNSFLLIIRGVPYVGIGIPYYLMFKDWQLLDTVWAPAFALTTIALPTAVWILRQFIDQIPREYEEQAEVDGASFFNVYFRVVLPLMQPGLATIFILTFFTSYNHYVFNLMLSRGLFSPVAVKVAGFATELTVRWSEMAAASVIAVIPMILFFTFFGKYLVRGVASLGVGVKG